MKIKHEGVTLKCTKPGTIFDNRSFHVTIMNADTLPMVDLKKVTSRAGVINCQQKSRSMGQNEMTYFTDRRPYTPYELAAFLASLAEAIAETQQNS